MKKLVRITTVPESLNVLLKGQLLFMKQFFEVIAISSDEEKMLELKKKEGVSVFTVNLTRKITPLKDLKALIVMYRYLKKEKPFIVHTHTPKAGIIGMLAAKLAKVPHRLHTVAGLPLLEAKGTKRIILNLVEKTTYQCATKVYPNSFGLKRIIENMNFVPKTKLKVIGKGSSNGINTKYFKYSNIPLKLQENLKRSLGIDESDFTFIYVGRIVGDKGINELVEAFNKLSITNVNVKLLLVGKLEPELDPLRTITQEIIQNNRQIITVGYQQDVRPYFAISNGLVFPSYREGFPNVVMQSCALGLPAIASNINGCNEIIKHNYNGLIIPIKDVQEIFNAMKLFVDDRLLLNRLKINTRPSITDNYEQEFIWGELLKEYKNL